MHRARHPRRFRSWATGVAVVATLLVPTAARAVCGDGITEFPAEQCDDGRLNGTAGGCCTTTCRLVDRDGDGVCDAYDHCDTVFGFVADGSVPRPRLRASRLDVSPADVKLRFTGSSTVPAIPFDPAADGLGVSFRGPYYYSDLLDVVLPAGAAWATTTHSWTYRDPSGAVGGVVGVRIKRRGGGRLDWRVDGRHMGFALAPADLPFYGGLRVTLTVAPATGPAGAGCGEMYWPTLLVDPQCDFDASGRAATCHGPLPELSCPTTNPDEMVQCALRSTARAQSVYFAAHGVFLSGLCSDLPGADVPPGVGCQMLSGALSFVAIAWHPQMTFVAGCSWASIPSPGKSHLSCEPGSF